MIKGYITFLICWMTSLTIGWIPILRPAISAERVDHGLYAQLIEKHVKAGVVDYGGMKRQEKMLDQYLALLEGTDTDALTKNERFAFYVNAYNAWTIKLILTGYPGVKSIKDLGTLFQSPWKKKLVKINGEDVSLDHIEHDILRPQFKDPRIHFAVNCASKSCPPLISEPYQGTTLDEQLDANTRAFVNNPKENRLEGYGVVSW